jgi:predicted NAD-dependent protein-ADP-ribosyltransferase YbiA (DUF1768 family)
LLRLNLSTQGKNFIEASRFDLEWGGGVALSEVSDKNQPTLRGANKMGAIMDKARDNLVSRHPTDVTMTTDDNE